MQNMQNHNLSLYLPVATSLNLETYKLLILQLLPVAASFFHDPLSAAVCNLSPRDVAVDSDTVQVAYTEPPMDYC